MCRDKYRWCIAIRVSDAIDQNNMRNSLMRIAWIYGNGFKLISQDKRSSIMRYFSPRGDTEILHQIVHDSSLTLDLTWHGTVSTSADAISQEIWDNNSISSINQPSSNMSPLPRRAEVAVYKQDRLTISSAAIKISHSAVGRFERLHISQVLLPCREIVLKKTIANILPDNKFFPGELGPYKIECQKENNNNQDSQ